MINIYIIVNSINNKIYIGQTSRSIQVRFAEHMRDPEYEYNRVSDRAFRWKKI